VVHIEPTNGFSADDVLQKLASVERASEHPLAMAIVNDAQTRKMVLSVVTDFDSPVGKGVTGTVDGLKVLSGSSKFLAESGIAVDSLAQAAEAQRAKAATVIFVGVGDKLAGFVAIADPIKATTPQALTALKAAGVRIVMLTGDGKTTAEAVGKELGIDEVVAEVFPEDKVAVVQRLMKEGRVVAMAGDGVNDSPALAAATVGIAMGTGTDAAMESAGVTLLKGDLMGIVRARALSHATMRNIRQNLFLSFAYNAAGIPLAAGVLYPLFGTLLSPVVAAAAMALSSVSVIGNALRLRTVKLD
jgi:Cu+-exporting ATPase